MKLVLNQEPVSKGKIVVGETVVFGYYNQDLPVYDEDKKVIEAFGVWGPKKFMGREYNGIHRTTFVIDETGKVAYSELVSEIANERELNDNTIFGHLASFIISGEVKITDLVPKVHYEELKEIIPKKKFDTLSDLKRQLDDKYSYGELRLVLDELKT